MIFTKFYIFEKKIDCYIEKNEILFRGFIFFFKFDHIFVAAFEIFMVQFETHQQFRFLGKFVTRGEVIRIEAPLYMSILDSVSILTEK